MELAGKTIIITGASSGIGEAAAKRFSRSGANVVLSARRAGLLRRHVDDIVAQGGSAIAVPGEVEDEKLHEQLVQRTLDAFGRLDGAFNNAGATGVLCPVTEMDSVNWRRVIDVNLTSAFFAAKHQIPALTASPGGSLVFTSSFVGHASGLPGMGAYGAAKAGLIGLVRALAVEHGASGVRVNALLPGGTMTAMAGEDADFHEVVRGFHALKRMAAPDEIAEAALYLLSDAASFVTGSAMYVDGGASLTKL